MQQKVTSAQLYSIARLTGTVVIVISLKSNTIIGVKTMKANSVLTFLRCCFHVIHHVRRLGVGT